VVEKSCPAVAVIGTPADEARLYLPIPTIATGALKYHGQATEMVRICQAKARAVEGSAGRSSSGAADLHSCSTRRLNPQPRQGKQANPYDKYAQAPDLAKHQRAAREWILDRERQPPPVHHLQAHAPIPLAAIEPVRQASAQRSGSSKYLQIAVQSCAENPVHQLQPAPTPCLDRNPPVQDFALRLPLRWTRPVTNPGKSPHLRPY